jgi:homoserine kinase
VVRAPASSANLGPGFDSLGLSVPLYTTLRVTPQDVTEVVPLENYWPAEDYHQDFFEKNPHQGYCMAVAAPKVAKFRKTFAARVRG